MAQSSVDPNAEASVRHRERFEAYAIALIFTVLGLSMQTAKFGAAPLFDLAEVLAWILLLWAGLCGLSRAEWIPTLYRHASERNRRHNAATMVRQAMWRGTEEVYDEMLETATPAGEYADSVKRAADEIGTKLRNLERVQLRKYRMMKWCFVAAVALLLVARGGPPSIDAIRSLSH